MRPLYFFFLFLLVQPLSARATPPVASWNLPTNLSDQNTTVSFEVDSTWHMVHGKTSKIQGHAKLLEEGNPRSVTIDLSIPVATFNTDWESRDERLREVMKAEKYPLVKFQGYGLEKNCTPAQVLQNGTCDDVLVGVLTLLETTEKVNIPITISVDHNQHFRVEGRLPLEWAQYGIEDPSILVARLDPVVTVHFVVSLPSRSSES